MHIGSFLFGLFTGISCGIVFMSIFIGWIYVIRHNENYKSNKDIDKMDV